MNKETRVPLKDITRRFEKNTTVQKRSLFTKALFNKSEFPVQKKSNSQILAKVTNSYTTPSSTSIKNIISPARKHQNGGIASKIFKQRTKKNSRTVTEIANSLPYPTTTATTTVNKNHNNQSIGKSNPPPLLQTGPLTGQLSGYLNGVYSMNAILNYTGKPVTTEPLPCREVYSVTEINDFLTVAHLSTVDNNDSQGESLIDVVDNGIILATFNEFGGCGRGNNGNKSKVQVGDYIHCGKDYYQIKVGGRFIKCYYRWLEVI